MTLYMIGLGLDNEKDITLKGLEAIKKCSKIFLEYYTSRLNCSIEKLEELYGKKIIIADRELVEQQSDKIILPAKNEDVAFLVIGDPMGATTHTDLMLRAKEENISVSIINNTSILNAVGTIGLELYKYGKTTSIVFPQPNWDVKTHYEVIKMNKSLGLHTLCLLDIKMKESSQENMLKEKKVYEEPKFMSVNQAIQNLLDIESERKEEVFTKDTICIGCARIGSDKQTIISGSAKELLAKDFGAPLHCLIVPGKMHFIEEEAVILWKK